MQSRNCCRSPPLPQGKGNVWSFCYPTPTNVEWVYRIYACIGYSLPLCTFGDGYLNMMVFLLASGSHKYMQYRIPFAHEGAVSILSWPPLDSTHAPPSPFQHILCYTICLILLWCCICPAWKPRSVEVDSSNSSFPTTNLSSLNTCMKQTWQWCWVLLRSWLAHYEKGIQIVNDAAHCMLLCWLHLLSQWTFGCWSKSKCHCSIQKSSPSYIMPISTFVVRVHQDVPVGMFELWCPL